MLNKHGKEGLGVIGILGLIVLLLVAGFLLYANFVEGGLRSITGTSLSQLYHTQIDPHAPSFFDNLESECEGTNRGDWYDERAKIGCFNTTTTLPSSSCNINPLLVQMRLVCESVEGTLWVCDSHNVGCKYA